MVQEQSKEANHSVADGFCLFNGQYAKNASSDFHIELLLAKSLIAGGNLSIFFNLSIF
jgi:hypothetical protein